MAHSTLQLSQQSLRTLRDWSWRYSLIVRLVRYCGYASSVPHRPIWSRSVQRRRYVWRALTSKPRGRRSKRNFGGFWLQSTPTKSRMDFGTYALMKRVPNCALSTRSLVDILTHVCHLELRVLPKSYRKKPTRSSETFQMFSLFLKTCSLLLKQMNNTSKHYARCSRERARKMFVSTATRSNFVCNIANT